MSAIGGMINFDGAPVQKQKLMSLVERLGTRGTDSANSIYLGSVAMVHRAFHTNAESRLEKQPFVSEDGCVLCWDGRLDNRAELISALRDRLRGDFTDVAIVMAAYLEWKESAFVKLVGDFALSLWEPHQRTLMLARDVMGIRPLYYHTDGSRFIWASDLVSIIDVSEIIIQINEEYVAGFLTSLPKVEDTPYKNIHAVRPGTTVITTLERVQERRFWEISVNRELHYKTDAEYEEHFQDLFRESVRCRLRADAPVWAELSGGMDSSSIVCMSADIIRNGEASIELNTVSRVFDEAAESDERKYIRPVEKKIGKRGLHLREDDHRILESWSSEYFASIPTYEATVAAYYRALQQAMSETGSRVVLSGHGGDNVLLGDGNPFPELSELLMAGRFLTLLRRLRLWTKSSNDSQVRFFWQKLLIRLLPFKLQRAQTRKINKVFRLYESAFVKRMRLRKRFVEPFAMFGVVDPGKKYRRTCFEVAQRQLAADGRHELCGVEFTYPFTHRPLVEFLYSVPIEQLIRPNENKSILRRALRNLVPFELIARQQARITIWPAIDKAARRESSRMRQLFLDAPSSIHDYLNVTAVLEACDQCNEYFDPYVISLVPFEYWLECVENLKSLGVSKQTSRSTRSSGIRFPLAAAASGQISSVEINN